MEKSAKTFSRLKKDLPDEFSNFVTFVQSAKKDGALSNKNKELIMVALSVCTQCSDCISLHIHDAFKSGATKKEVLEAAMMAVVMGGGPKLMYMSQVYAEVDKYFS
jgi:AhpD family alkylhydroperoxidase